MLITPELRKHASEKLAVAADADEATITKAVADAVLAGSLTVDQLKSLTAGPAAAAKAEIGGIVAKAVADAMAPVAEQIGKLASALSGKAAGEGNAAATAATAGQTAASDLATKSVSADAQKAYGAGAGAGGNADPNAGNANADAIRVKSVVEQFAHNPTAATWDKSSKAHLVKSFGGRQVMSAHEGPGAHGIEMPTERTKAICGAWFKHMVRRACKAAGRALPQGFAMNEVDEMLVKYAAHELPFTGGIEVNDQTGMAKAWYDGSRLSDVHRKALLDDSTSGGVEAVPRVFDDLAILTPLLNGELLPYVRTVNVRGRLIDGFSMGNPTVAWGTAEGTEITPFTTDGLIAAFDTTIYPITGAIEIGLDFESDTPVGVGDLVVNRFGEQFRTAMDNVIASGSGTARPQGVLLASGITAVTPSGGAGAAQTVTDYEGLLFAVKKQYRAEARPSGSFAFIGTETSYSRARGIVVSGTDQRRVFGTDNYEDYRLLGQRYAINESLTNAQILAVCLNRYRLYRRSGFEVRVVTEDKELALKNQRLIVVRARYGGKLELSGAAAKITNGQA